MQQLLLNRLAKVPADAARISGPRDNSDLSFRVWLKIKDKVGHDFENPTRLSLWRQKTNFVDEFKPLGACTNSQDHLKLLLHDRKVRNKNRYSDILAFEHSRVHLVPRDSLADVDPLVSGYINANYVDGPVGDVNNRKIIACQGPLDNTYADLWRMVS